MDVTQEEKQRIREKIEKLKQSKFKQQTLPAWRPVPTAMSTMLTFSIFSVIFMAIGIILLVMSEQITEIETQYDANCGKVDFTKTIDNTCIKNTNMIKVEKDITGPIYVYYQLDNFYQNHRRYVKSRDNEQLAGKYLKVESLGNCDPIVKVKHLWKNQKVSVAEKEKASKDSKYTPIIMSDDSPAIPCGLVAKSFFNDTYQLYKCLQEDCSDFPVDQKGIDENPKYQPIGVDDSMIAWDSDKTFKFKNINENFPQGISNWKDIQWHSMEDEHFIVWMRTAGLPNFRKLWGKIDSKLEKGSYQLVVKNNFEVASFQGKKSFVLSTTNALGGKNYFLAICYIAVGGLCLLFSLVFCIVYMKKRNGAQEQD